MWYVVRIVLLLFALLMPLTALAKSSEDARVTLGKMNVPYTSEGFVSSLDTEDKVVIKLFLDAGFLDDMARKKGVTYSSVVLDHLIGLVQMNRGNETIFLKTIKYFLSLPKKFDLNVKDSRGSTLLIFASRVGFLETVKFLLLKGVDVNRKADDDTTALAWAMEYEQIVRLLLNKGADVNTKDERGGTPLMKAALKGNMDMVKELLVKGAKINDRDESGGTALTHATEGLKEGKRDEYGIIGTGREFEGGIELIKFLLEKGADLNPYSSDPQYSPLMLSAYSGHYDVVRLLLDKGVDVSNFQNALDIAVEWCRPKTAEALMSTNKEIGDEILKRLLSNAEYDAKRARSNDNKDIEECSLEMIRVLKKDGKQE